MSRALIVVDEQVDFCEGGSLAVEGGAHVAKMTALYLDNHSADYDVIVATKDWHMDPGQHWARLGETPDYQASWPVHCAVKTAGSDFHPNVVNAIESRAIPVFYKGLYEAAYSGFEAMSLDLTSTDLNPVYDLDSYLKYHDVDHVDIVGIATDYCCAATARDAVKLGYQTRLLVNMTAAVHPEKLSECLGDLEHAGVETAIV